ncbi:uncharacterized protein LOC128133534 [Lactuca sativa]|uniref:uncharacterized protein LOC128133534 n=1 Tax=Lactuca sativa TaxID=4236 RepID=UPI0022B0136B|nr:uncharacterized protein LOC128133534 [Lactuca sativa]
MVFGVPPSLFEHIKLCKSAKEIWDTLQDLFEGSENTMDKRLNSVVNEFDTFTTSPGYWSSGLERDDEDAKQNYCYMATNDLPGRSIIQQALYASEQETIWYIDSPCSMHMTGQKDLLRNLKLSSNDGYVTYGNNSNSQIPGYGILKNGNFSISNVAYVADLKNNLISVAQLTNANRRVEF